MVSHAKVGLDTEGYRAKPKSLKESVFPIRDYFCGGPVLGEDVLKGYFCELQGIYVGPCGDEVGHFSELVYYY